ncbi:MAG TPA: twin-arginine translocation signal domain-containing protein, partial [Dissulfurispiraceae bacterium]|nr:twin-arginine translocation signal domain-containing protein [Dissulfurispiraceae bacterium]
MKKITGKKRELNISRRNFLTGAAAGLAGAMLPLNKADASFWEVFFQKHFIEMNDAEKKKVI